MITGDHAAGARHIGYRDRRVARDEASEVAAENPRIDVSTTARRKSDDDAHDFAAIEFGYGTLIDIRAAALRCQNRDYRAGEKKTNQRCYRNSQFFCLATCAAMYHKFWAIIFILFLSPHRVQLRFPCVHLPGLASMPVRIAGACRSTPACCRLPSWKPTANSK